MQKITSLVINRPKSIFIMLLLISAAAVWRLGDLSVDASLDGLMKTHDPGKLFYDSIQETFGSDNTMVVFIEDKNLFTAKRLRLLQSISAQLASIEGVSRVTSLFTLKNLKHSEQGLQSSLFAEQISDSAVDLNNLKNRALSNPFARNLVSSDGTAMVLHVHIRRDWTGSEADLMNAIEEIILPLRTIDITLGQNALTFERVFQIGAPVVREELRETFIADQNILILLALAVMLIFLLLRLKSFSGLIVPVLIAGLSVLWIFGAMAAIGWPVTVLTAMVPVLIIVLGSMQAAYLLNQYSKGLRAAKNKRKALMATAGELGLGFLLSVLALIIGVLSIGLFNVQVLQQFSKVAALGLVFHFVIAASLIPLYLLAFGSTQAEPESRSIFDRAAETMLIVLSVRKPTVLTAAVLLALVLGSGIIWLSIDNEPQAYFDQQGLIHTRSDIVTAKLPGLHTFSIVFNAEDDGALQNPALLNEIKKVQDFIRQMKLFDANLSIVDLLMLLNREVNQGDPQYFRIPAPTSLVQQYITDFLTRDDLEPYVSADFKQAVVRVWHQPSSSDHFSQVLARLKEFTDTLDKRLSVRLSGTDILINAGAEALLTGQFKTLLILIAVVFALVSLLFMSFKAGLIALAPSLFALCVLFGLMGYLAIPLTIGTVIVAAFALSITLGYTLCIMIRYNAEVRDDGNEHLAMERALRTELVSIGTASLMLSAGFAVMLAARLTPMVYFGGLMAAILLVALLANLFITPKLLTSMRFVTLWGMARVSVGRKILEDCELFAGMHIWQVKQIILLSQVRQVAVGEVFIQQGAVGHEMFVILEGQARVEKTTAEGRKQVLFTAQQGDVMGEIALVAQQERTASVVAATDMKLLVLEWQSLEQLGRFLPMISAQLFLNIARIIGRRFVGK